MSNVTLILTQAAGWQESWRGGDGLLGKGEHVRHVRRRADRGQDEQGRADKLWRQPQWNNYLLAWHSGEYRQD